MHLFTQMNLNTQKMDLNTRIFMHKVSTYTAENWEHCQVGNTVDTGTMAKMIQVHYIIARNLK